MPVEWLLGGNGKFVDLDCREAAYDLLGRESLTTCYFAPEWSPDGQKIVFDSTRDGNFEIYVMDADGGNVERLTSNNHFDGHPDW